LNRANKSVFVSPFSTRQNVIDEFTKTVVPISVDSIFPTIFSTGGAVIPTTTQSSSSSQGSTLKAKQSGEFIKK